MNLASLPLTLSALIAHVLIQFLWQGALLALVLAVALRLTQSRSAALRHALACGTLGLMLAAPVLTLLLAWPQPSTHSGADLFSVATPTTTADGSHSLAPSLELSWMPWITWLWLAGVVTLALRWLGGWWQLNRLITRHSQPASVDWQRRLEALIASLAWHGVVRLRESSHVTGPLVVGGWRPVILLPLGLLTGLPTVQIEAILLHELAHLRGRDFMINGLQRVAETILFYHPAVWWVSDQIRREREFRCDDLVVTVQGEGRSLAEALLTLAERQADLPPFALAADGGSLPHRIRRLLGASGSDSPTPGFRKWRLSLLAGLLLALGVGAVATFSGPRMYQATARVVVNNPSGVPIASKDYDPYYLHTQMEVFRSAAFLTPIIEQLSLAQRWNMSTGGALAEMRKRLRVRQYRNTAVVEITVAAPKSEDAAYLANAVVQRAVSLPSEQQNRRREELLLKRGQMLQELEMRIRQAENELQEIDGAKGPMSPGTRLDQEKRAAFVKELDMLREFRVSNMKDILADQTAAPSPTSFEIIDEAVPPLRASRWQWQASTP